MLCSIITTVTLMNHYFRIDFEITSLHMLKKPGCNHGPEILKHCITFNPLNNNGFSFSF